MANSMQVLNRILIAFAIFSCLCLPALTTATAQGTSDPVFQHSDAEVLIMSLRLIDGSTLSDDFLVYPKDGQHFFRFQDFCISAGILCESTGSSITGFFFREAWKFRINCQEGSSSYRQKTLALTTLHCAVSNSEIFLTVKALEELFSLQIETRLDRSDLIITSDQLFPVQEKNLREQRSIESAKRQDIDPAAINYAPSRLFSWGGLDLRVSSRGNNLKKRHRPEHMMETTQSFEIFGMDFFQYLAGDGDGISSRRQTLQKVDTYGRVLPVGIRDIKLIDVETPAVPLVGSRSGRGFYLASFGPTTPDGFDRHNFRGFLPNGWEVELYQNGLLIARQTADDKGFYKFSDIALTYGGNQFRLVFYGPQGQTYEEYKIFNIDPNMTRKGEVRYQAGFVQEKTSTATTDEAGTQVEASLNSLATFSLGAVSSRRILAQPNTGETRAQYATVGLRGFLPGLFWRLDGAWQDTKGHAKQLSLKIPIDQVTANLSLTQLEQYTSKWFQIDGIGLNQQDIAGLTWAPRFLPIYMSAEGKKNGYTDRGDLDFFVHRLGTAAGSFYITHEWQRELGSSTPFTARLAANYLKNLSSLRTELGYNKDQVIDSALTFDSSLAQDRSVGISSRRLFAEGRTEVQTYYNFIFSNINWQTYLGWDTVNKEYIGASFATSFARYQEGRSKLFRTSEPVSDGATLTVRVFVDKNNNGIFDPSDAPLPGVYVLHNGQRSLDPSDDDGLVRIPRIPAYVTTQIVADIKTVEDPLLIPSKQMLWVEGRRGPPLHLDYPFGYSGEVDGYIYQTTASGRTGLPDRKISVKNLNDQVVASTTSFSDGYYLLQGLKPGDYSVQLDDSETNLKISPQFIKITIPETGGFVSVEPFTAETVLSEH